MKDEVSYWKEPTVSEVKEFPQQCSFCDVILNDKKQLKKHMRTHSYSLVQFKCDLCDFMGYDEIDMDVHAAKFHSDKCECGLCGFEAKNLEDLEIHLTTCEYYTCEVCNEKIRQFTDIKVHFETKHTDYSNNFSGVRNVKPSRENFDIYDKRFHHITSLFPELK